MYRLSVCLPDSLLPIEGNAFGRQHLHKIGQDNVRILHRGVCSCKVALKLEEGEGEGEEEEEECVL